MTDTEPTDEQAPDHGTIAAALAHSAPAEALVHATLHLADVFAAAWPPMSELMGDGPVPDRFPMLDDVSTTRCTSVGGPIGAVVRCDLTEGHSVAHRGAGVHGVLRSW